ncbi:hypothetical protein Dsin_015052 [Dipteronia sinensis]|uniref:Rad50/SbcC-type AAA domain-containing protein n=1 Tax=Dipteronia sinensis TaxID=43782 RepID=A0AAE0APA2_9ROSI|nr:hypothetical protein Dsin_015052 [Dipteronia sinensis]
MASGSRVYSDSTFASQRSGAATITRIRLENFMCHSSLQIELGEWVNFITGQNGSGKSAILTALCIAFGCRAKGTQRAATLKDFIKTGCSYAVVQVELKNQGEDAFKPEIYGDSITIERRITESTTSTVLKDHQGKRVASRKQELYELTDHFNIDVENPCVIMSQDKSREFLHSGNDKDKFKFFFKATLLQQVSDLLRSIYDYLNNADAIVVELETSIKPIQLELRELQRKIKNMEHVEEISQQVQQLKKKLAWSWVYDVDRQLEEQNVKIGKLKDRIPACQAKIDFKQRTLEKLRDRFMEKKAQIAVMVEKTSEVKRRKDELNHSISLASKEKHELVNEHDRKTNYIKKQVNRLRFLEQQVQDIHEQDAKNTQAEASEIKEKLKELKNEVDAAKLTFTRLKEEESALSENRHKGMSEIKKIADEIEDYEKKYNEIRSYILELQQHQTNKVTAFGGERVINLLRAIERHHHRFKRPPIGPIGVHVTMVNGDMWGPAVEQAIGRLLNAFIVTDHKDALLLRGCAKDANYNNLQIFIYDFSRPRLNLPHHMLPQTNHPTILSVLHSDNPTVINVLVDMGNVERQVLVRDYDAGKAVAFEQRISNLKEVFTLDGHRMFSRGSVQTILPLNKKMRTGRLCSSYDEKIKDLEKDALNVREESQRCRKRKRDSEERLKDLEHHLHSVKRKCTTADRTLMAVGLELRDAQSVSLPEASSSSASTVYELCQEISKVQEEIQEKESLLEKLRVSINEAEAKVNDLKLLFASLCESAKEEINAFEESEKELMEIEKDLQSSEAEKTHYETIMNNKVIPEIKEADGTASGA